MAIPVGAITAIATALKSLFGGGPSLDEQLAAMGLTREDFQELVRERGGLFRTLGWLKKHGAELGARKQLAREEAEMSRLRIGELARELPALQAQTGGALSPEALARMAAITTGFPGSTQGELSGALRLWLGSGFGQPRQTMMTGGATAFGGTPVSSFGGLTTRRTSDLYNVPGLDIGIVGEYLSGMNRPFRGGLLA